jgi:hypothetical protein
MIPLLKVLLISNRSLLARCAILVFSLVHGALGQAKPGPAVESIEQVPSMELSDAPSAFIEKLAEIKQEWASQKNRFLVAGRVQDTHGIFPDSDRFAVALKHTLAAGEDLDLRQGEDTYRFDGGWFVSPHLDQRDPRTTLFAASFYHRPVAKVLDVRPGEITWAHVFLAEATPDELSSVELLVRDEEGNPVPDASAHFLPEITNGSLGSAARLQHSETTDAEGRVVTPKLIHLFPYGVSVHKDGFSSDYAILRPGFGFERPKNRAGEHLIYLKHIVANAPRLTLARHSFKPGEFLTEQPYHAPIQLCLGYPRRILIDFEIETENAFIGKSIVQNAVLTEKGYLFLDHALEPNGYSDLVLDNSSGTPYFRHFHTWGKAGSYDLGPVDFGSVHSLDLGKLSLDDTVCRLNHTYGVRTLKGRFVKFVVRKIETLKPQ